LHFIKVFWLSASLIWPDDFVSTSEDYIDLKYEPEEIINSSFLYRVRTIEKDGKDNWHQKLVYTYKDFQLGFRLDKSIDDHHLTNQKIFLSGNLHGYNINIGSLRFHTGNGLVLGNEYAAIKSPFNPASMGKLFWRTGTYLGAASYYNPVGILAGKDDSFKMGVIDNTFISTGKWDYHQYLLIPTAVISGEKKPLFSLAVKKDNDSWGISTETAVQKVNFAQFLQFYSRNTPLKFLAQYRYLSPNWQPFSGNPASGLGKPRNERGVLIAVYFKGENVSIYGWQDIAREIINNNEPTKNAQELFLGTLVQGLPVKVDLNYRQKNLREKMEEQLAENKRHYITLTLTDNWKIRGKFLYLQPREIWGYVIQMQTKKIEMGNYFSTLGTIYFNTHDWSSRVYLVLPGMAGEFSLKPYYGEGISFYSVLKYELDSTHRLFARYSLSAYHNGHWELNSEFALQLDIVF